MAKYIVNPVQVREKEAQKTSIYQSIVAMGFRARQINEDIKKEIADKMEDIVPLADETEGANSEQVAISVEFEKMPKPSFMAMSELYNDELSYKLNS